MRRVLLDCPPGLKPQYNRMDTEWRFPNGSVIRAAGCDGGNAERLRGTEAHLALVDEAGFTGELEYVVQDILMPQTITTDGRILLVSTPSVTPAHDFIRYCVRAEQGGTYEHRTIFQAPHITPSMVEEYAAECGGKDTSTWKREYLAQFVTDTDMAVVPEFSSHEDAIVGTVERPPYFHTYVSMDVGYHDLTVALLAYVHFDAAKLVIEDEVVLRHTVSREIDEQVNQKERELWEARNKPLNHPMNAELWEPLLRVVDAPAQVVADLCNFHGRNWLAADKDDAAAALNALRLAVSGHKILIHPRCTTLISHLKHAIWNRSRSSYERSGDFGHFDAVDALKYLLRAADLHQTPYPRHWDIQTTNKVWMPTWKPVTTGEKLQQALLGVRK